MKTVYLMNINTGSVDTLEGWQKDYEHAKRQPYALEENPALKSWEEWSRELVEVVQDEDGNWVEVQLKNRNFTFMNSTSENPYKCWYCSKTFAKRYQKKVHERIHTGKKPYKCKYCDKAFTALAGKLNHEKTHTSEKPYKCGYCDKNFARDYSKIVHERTHTGEKPYKCRYCNKAFHTSSNRISHEKYHKKQG